ncbi:MAG: DUF2779 domain-containing protein [Myxococcota bacterium]
MPDRIDAGLHLAGLQCERRLWLEAHDPAGADRAGLAERDAGARARAELRELAASLLPEAERDAVFAARGLEARADFLVRDSGGELGLRAVSAGARPSETDLDELAFVVFVAAAAGRELASVAVLHPDPDYVRGPGPVDVRAFLRHTDVSRDVAFLARDLAARVGDQARVLASPEEPPVEPSPHCRRPRTCVFWKRCTRAKAADWIGYLPALRPQTHAALAEAAVARIGDVPEDFPLSPPQRNARRSAQRGGPIAAPDLARALAELGPAPDYLDFEAILPEIPRFPGTRPLEPVPFQWSAHLAAADAALEHAEYLADGSGDPRRGFAESLIAAFAARTQRVAVYSSFESEVLELQMRAFPDLAAALERVRSRLFDLLPVVRRSVYHPAFLGSFSLKRVAPVLAPGFGFDDLPGIADGGAASRGWLALARGELSAARAAALLAELRAYCARDSLALAVLLRALRGLAAAATDASHSSP